MNLSHGATFTSTTYDLGEERGSFRINTLNPAQTYIARRSTEETVIGLRFSGVTIPQGATVSAAYIQFHPYAVNTAGNLRVRIRVEDSSIPAALAATTANLSGRTYFDPGLTWNITNWTDTTTQ